MKYGIALVLSLILLLGNNITAQKSEVLGAFKHLQVYQSNNKCNELKEAKEAIDAAVTDSQTNLWTKTWKYHGDIYFEISVSNDKACNTLSDTALNIAFTSYIKALNMDVKRHYMSELHTKLAVVGPYFLKFGVEEYNKENYTQALRYFQKSIHTSEIFKKVDSLGIYNAALAAEQIKKYDLAQKYYKKLIEVKYGGAKIYSFLANAYLKSGDTTQNFSTILMGRESYPKNKELIVEELNYYIEHGQYEEALKVLKNAIDIDPQNYLYHFYKATIHDNRDELDLAEYSYKKSIEFNPEYFDAYFNLGALLYNQGLDLSDKAYQESGVDESILKASRDNFKRALPYLEKANKLNEFDRPTLISLQKIYSILGDDEGYKRVTHELEN